MTLKAMTFVLLTIVLTGCRIEPPLNLEVGGGVTVAIGQVVTNLEVIWNTDTTWRNTWWYGWDDDDIRRWGEIAYPEPTNYEGRFYYFGETPSTVHEAPEGDTYYTSTIRRTFKFGYHNMLVWSNIDSKDGTQVLIVDESDADNIKATTSHSRLSYSLPGSRTTEVFNNPEVFYSAALNDIFISRSPEDYDYFDPQLNAWVKSFETDMYPMVYIYLVQVVIYNNRGRIQSLTDNAAIDNMADAVNVHTGHTSNSPAIVSYEMGFKHDRPARDGAHADIFGGKFTTFGLCDMEPWSKSRGTQYGGSRSDLANSLAVCMHFSNESDSAYRYEVTPQMQRQAHGGVITIEIDADTLVMPTKQDPGGPSSGFDPIIAPSDSITHEIPM